MLIHRMPQLCSLMSGALEGTEQVTTTNGSNPNSLHFRQTALLMAYPSPGRLTRNRRACRYPYPEDSKRSRPWSRDAIAASLHRLEPQDNCYGSTFMSCGLFNRAHTADFP